MRDRLLPYAHQVVEPEDRSAVERVLRSDWLTTGPEVEQFEASLAAAVGARHAVAFSSGTAALHAAVAAAGVGPGDEGITSPITFVATANCLLFQGARPAFADVEDATLTIDPTQIERRLTRRTKVILPVDYGGHPAALEAVRAIARRRGLLVIEDACHALGATSQGQRVGSISDMTVFSFHPVKHITTGEGGMVTTNRAALAVRLRRFRSHGIIRPRREQSRRPWYYEMVELGYNYRMSDIACALGRSQLARLPQNLRQRRRLAQRYTEALRDLPLRLPAVRPGVEPAWHLYPVRLQPQQRSWTRDALFRALRAEQIGVNVHYIPVPRHPYYRRRFGYRAGEFPVAERAYEQLLTLPLYHGMTDRDADDVVETLRRLLSGTPSDAAACKVIVHA